MCLILGLFPFVFFIAIIDFSDLKGCTKGLFKWHDWEYKSSYKMYEIESIRKLSERLLDTSFREVNKRYECKKCGKIKHIKN